MPSHFQRLLQKTCGLFDTGFAGSDFDAASFEVNAPATDPQTANKSLLLADFEGGQAFSTETPFHLYPDVNVNNEMMDKFEQPKQLTTSGAGGADCVDTEGWVELGDPLAALDTDPLGDSSLDAFINLDQLLMQDAFLDEVNEVQPVIEMKPQMVEPVISIPSPAGGEQQQQFDLLDLLENPTEVIPVYQDPSLSYSSLAPITTPSAKATKGMSRKRKATAKATTGPVKTSMFEISQPISENIVTTTFINPVSPELDHAYTTKFKLTEAVVECDAKTSFVETTAVDCKPSTSTEAVGNKSRESVDKQSIRRQKNNIASKRSREQRKQKFSDLDREAEELIVANEALRIKIVELEKMAKEMKAVLVAKMSGK